MSTRAFERIYRHHECTEHSDLRPVLWCGRRDVHKSHHWTQQQSSIIFAPEYTPMYCEGTAAEEVTA